MASVTLAGRLRRFAPAVRGALALGAAHVGAARPAGLCGLPGSAGLPGSGARLGPRTAARDVVRAGPAAGSCARRCARGRRACRARRLDRLRGQRCRCLGSGRGAMAVPAAGPTVRSASSRRSRPRRPGPAAVRSRSGPALSPVFAVDEVGQAADGLTRSSVLPGRAVVSLPGPGWSRPDPRRPAVIDCLPGLGRGHVRGRVADGQQGVARFGARAEVLRVVPGTCLGFAAGATGAALRAAIAGLGLGMPQARRDRAFAGGASLSDARDGRTRSARARLRRGCRSRAAWLRAGLAGWPALPGLRLPGPRLPGPRRGASSPAGHCRPGCDRRSGGPACGPDWRAGARPRFHGANWPGGYIGGGCPGTGG